MSQTTAEIQELNEKLFKILNLQADAALKEAQLRLAALQSRNLHADTGPKREQQRLAPWQIWTSAVTAGATLGGALMALGHWLLPQGRRMRFLA